METVLVKGEAVPIGQVNGRWMVIDHPLSMLGSWPDKSGLLSALKTMDEA